MTIRTDDQGLWSLEREFIIGSVPELPIGRSGTHHVLHSAGMAGPFSVSPQHFF